MLEFLKRESFKTAANFLVALAIMTLFVRKCTGGDCEQKRAAPIEQMTKPTWQIGTKCYQFTTETASCPDTGVIEAFQVRHAA